MRCDFCGGYCGGNCERALFRAQEQDAEREFYERLEQEEAVEMQRQYEEQQKAEMKPADTERQEAISAFKTLMDSVFEGGDNEAYKVVSDYLHQPTARVWTEDEVYKIAEEAASISNYENATLAIIRALAAKGIIRVKP